MLGLNLNRLLDRLVPCNLVFSSLGKNRESLERGKDLRIAFSPSEKPEAFKRHPLQGLQIVPSVK